MCSRSAMAITLGVALWAAGSHGAFPETAPFLLRNGRQIACSTRVGGAHLNIHPCNRRQFEQYTARVPGDLRVWHRPDSGGRTGTRQPRQRVPFSDALFIFTDGHTFSASSLSSRPLSDAIRSSDLFATSNVIGSSVVLGKNTAARSGALVVTNEPPSEFRLVGGMGMPAGSSSDNSFLQYRGNLTNDNDSMIDRLANSIGREGMHLGVELHY